MIGTTIGRYRVISKLGEGGMGSVWLAEDPVLGRTVALKLLPEGSTHSSEARERLLREARTACKLHHPGIATVYEAGEEAGRIYLAFEHVDGETVAERVKREGPLPVEEALRIAREVAEALGHAHGKGVLHRDLTSGNVMLDSTGQAKLVDFGLALPEGETRVTRPASTPGTIGYVAPEVVKGERSDRRADLWGLGVVLYEMLTGRLPFERDRAEAVLYAVVNEEPESPRRHRKDLPEGGEAVVLRALAKNPGQRFADAGELLAALQEGADAGEVRPRSRRLRRAALVAVPVVAVAAFVAWWPDRDSSARFDSVAVLPLSLPGENAEEIAYLATGLADALVTRLGRLSELRITPWVTSRRYPPSALPLFDIARELNVQSLVVGSFREEEGTLHVELSLREPETGTSTWSATFEDTKIGLLELQEEMVLAVARTLRGSLAPEEEQALIRRPTDRADAYDHYLRGSAALQAGTREAVEQALARFETALAIDPRLAEAWVGVGAGQTHRYYSGWGGVGSAILAEESFRRALETDPELIAAVRGLIRVHWVTGRNEECLRLAAAVREGGELSIESLLAQADGMLMGGLPDEAVPLYQTVRRQDPANLACHLFLVIAHAWAGDAPGTIRAGEEFLRTFGEDHLVHYFVAGAHGCHGDRDAALRHYEQFLALAEDRASPDVLAGIALRYRGLAGQDRARAVAREGIRQLESRSREGWSNPNLDSELACLYAIVGDTTEVLEHGGRVRADTDPRFSPNQPFHLLFAYAEIGDDETANHLLLERADRLRKNGTRTGAVEEGTGHAGRASFQGQWLEECMNNLDGPRLLERLPAFGNLMDALHEEEERLRSLYGG